MDRLEVKAAITVSDEGEITGTAWPFGSPDRVGDVIEKGAFRAPATLPMLFSHDHSQVVGVWSEIAETDAGLTVKGKLLVDDVPRAREVRAMIREKAVTDLSIGFVAKSAKPRQRGRTITALDLHEISVVAVPCHPAAQITSIKAADGTATAKELTPMENEAIETDETVETKADPVVDQKTLDAMKTRLDKLEAKANRPIASNNNQPNAVNDNGDAETKSFFSVMRKGEARIGEDERKALTVADDATAGYLAPESFGNELIKLLKEFSPIRQYARVVSIGAKEIKYPRRIGSPAAFWVGETADRTHSEPAYAQLSITPHELATFTDVSTQLLEDNAFNLEGELTTEFAEAFATTEGLAFLKGTGNVNNQPVGLLTNASIEAMTTGDIDGFPDAAPADVLISMFHRLPTAHAQRGVWMMNRNTLGTIRKWKDGNGNYLVLDPISAGMPTTMLGRPVVECLDMDDIAAGTTPIVFGDLQGYRIIDRIQLSVLRDPYTLATKGQVRFHARRRTGGDVTHPDRFIKLTVAA